MRNLTIEFVNGEMPESLEELTASSRDLCMVKRRRLQISAIAIATAYHTHFGTNRAGWYSWVAEIFELKGKEPQAYRRVGELLTLSKSDMPKEFPRLFNLDSKKLLQVCRLAVTQVAAFLSSHKVEQMDRAQVKSAVDAYLSGIPQEPGELPVRPHQALLPGFDDAVDQLTKFDSDVLRNAVRDTSSAQKSLFAGMALLGASLEFEKNSETPNVELLKKAREALIAEAAAIDDLIAGKTGCAMAHQKAISE